MYQNRYYSTAKGKATRARSEATRKRKAKVAKALALIDKSKAIEVSAVLEYQRGLRHGLEAARAIVYRYNNGRSWSSTEMAGQISGLIADIPATAVVVGDLLDGRDEIPCGAEVLETFWKPRRAL